MKSLRLFDDALIFSALFVLSTAYADKGVYNATITPDEFFTNTPTTITVSAEIGVSTPYPPSVAVYQTTADSKPTLKLGQMSGAPVKKNEASSQFSLQFNVNKPTQETLYIRVITDYGGDSTPYQGAIMPINAYEQISASTIHQYEDILKALKQAYVRHQKIMPTILVRHKTYLEAKHNPAIQQASIHGDFLSVLFKGGVRGSVKLDKFDPLENTVKNTATPPPNAINDAAKHKLLIFAPGYSDASPQNHIADLGLSLFKQSAYLPSGIQEATVLKDSQASLEAIKHWGDYQAVILHTHGGVWGLNPNAEEVFLLSGTSSLAPLSQQNALDLSAGRIGIKGLDKFVIFPGFITKHARAMPDSFFYLGACYSLANNTLWQALQNKGAKVAFGWSNSVARGFNADTFKKLLSPMLSAPAAQAIYTAKQAYDAIPDKVDGWCPFNALCLEGDGATLTLKTATPAWGHFAFSNSGLMMSETSNP